VRTCAAPIAVALCVTLASGVRAPAQAQPAPAPRAEPTFESLQKAAEQARAAGKLDEAVGFYQKALEKRPAWVEGRWALGTVLYSLERFQEARDAFRRVTAAKPEDASSWAFKGLCEFELKNYDRAVADLQQAQQRGLPNKEIAHVASYHLGILLNRYEQFEASLELLAQLTREGNESASIAEALGLSILRIPVLPAELPPQKREMVLMAGRATIHWAGARRTPARAGFEELVLRFPEEKNVHYAFGVFLHKEDPEAALAQWNRELAISPYHVEAMLQIALEKVLRAELQEALELAQKAVELAPRNAAGRNILGRVLLNMDDVPGAIEQLEVGVKIAPTSRQMRFEMAQAYARAGRTEDAAREREEFRKLEAAERARASERPLGGIDLEAKKEPR
jgi:tetratricopeptide (TPR) repeat protein